MAFSAEDTLQRLTTAQEAGTLAHAYLICGAPGTGKNELARKLAALVLHCQNEALDSHPDFHTVQPASKSRRIIIEQMRLLEQSIQKRPSIGTAKVAIIQEADRLAPNAANAFLKTLEEPPSGTYLLLISSQPDSLLPTILSRCIQVPLHTPERRTASAQEKAIVALFDRCLQSDIGQVAQAFQFVRGFQALLAESKEKASDEAMEEFETDKQHYKNTTDGKWLEDREDRLKAVVGSASLRLRRDLVATVENHLAEGLRASCRGHIPPDEAIARIAQIPQKTLLRQMESLGRLQRLLDRGVHEPLALEACFLEVFSLIP